MNPEQLVKLPPQDVESEADALAAVLFAALGAAPGDTSTREAERCLAEFDVDPSDLYSACHRRILTALRTMSAGGESLIPQVLKIRLGALGGDPASDLACVDSLLQRNGSPAHQRTYAAIVREQAGRRRLLAIGVRLQQEAQSGMLPEHIIAAFQSELERESQGAGPVTAVQAHPVAELLATAEPQLPWLIQGLLTARFVLALVSEAKSGKSSLLATYVRSLLTGQPYWGRKVRQVPAVLWVTEEDASSVALMCIEYGLRGLDGLHFLTRSDLAGLSYPGQQVVIARERDRLGAEVMILDTLSAHARFEDENSNAEMERAIAPWKGLAARTGCCVIVTHHANKSEGREGWAQVRGGSAFAGAVDAGFLLKRRPGNVRRLEFLGGRGSDWAERLEYERHEDVAELGTRWRLAEVRQASAEENRRAKEDEAKRETNAVEAAVLEHVRAIPGVTRSKLERKVPGGTQRIRDAIDRLHTRRELRREVRSQAFCYFLASDLDQPAPTPPRAPSLRGGRGRRGQGGGATPTPPAPPDPASGAAGGVLGPENAPKSTRRRMRDPASPPEAGSVAHRSGA